MRLLIVATVLVSLPLLLIGAEAPPAPPAEPTTVTDVDMTPGADSIKITWQATEGKGITGWMVECQYYSAVGSGMVKTVTPVPAGARSFTLTGLKPGRSYHLRLYPYVKEKKMIRPAPVTAPVPVQQVRVGKPWQEAPAAPKGLAAVADATGVWLSWQPSPETNVAGYEILRKAPGEEDATPYAKLLLTGGHPQLTAFAGPNQLRNPPDAYSGVIDLDVVEGQAYAYSVRAFTGDAEPKRSPAAGPITVDVEPYVLASTDVLLVVNTNAPDAMKIANAYCRARGIKKPNGVKVKLPVGAQMTREQFETVLLPPIRKRLAEHPRVTVILLIRGVPWRIQESGGAKGVIGRNGWELGAVDAELALARFYGDYPLEGALRNPLFKKAAVLSPVNGILAVCRLDGPDDATANDLVKRAILAERKGVEGIAFFDARGLKAGAYLMGDTSIRAAAEMMKKDGRMPVEIDDKEPVIDLSGLNKKIGFYWGWYAGGFRPKNKEFRFGRGAVAAHIHSYSAVNITTDKNWVGPLLHYGATATVGTVHEPYLDGYPYAEALLDALLQGRNFAEAALSADRYLSWMSIHVGDPLYRPFKPKAEADADADPEE